MKMRELEERTGTHREVIRIYIRNGLIPQPERAGRTVAIYGEQHVQAIIAIKKLQKESRLTLAQIKQLIDGGPAEARVDASAFDRLEQLVAHRTKGDGPSVTISSLLDSYPDAERDARSLAKIGILDIIDSGQGAALSISDAQLVRIWGEMRRAGFDGGLDYTPEILGFYIDAADFVGRWEARTFLERTDGRIDVDRAANMVEHALPLMLDFFGLLRQRAFFRHVGEIRSTDRPIP
ncbi:MAG: MerR family transcriptional regulator [Sphingobium sp.]|nr:MerR family transcriptional regulator [Sphingobium sp.]